MKSLLLRCVGFATMPRLIHACSHLEVHTDGRFPDFPPSFYLASTFHPFQPYCIIRKEHMDSYPTNLFTALNFLSYFSLNNVHAVS